MRHDVARQNVAGYPHPFRKIAESGNFREGEKPSQPSYKTAFWEEAYGLADLAMRNVNPFFAEWNAT